MTPRKIRTQVVLERVAWTRKMLDALDRLPLSNLQAFLADERTPAAAESYLRRVLEALFDLGRHILARAFGEGVVEYNAIAAALREEGVLIPALADTLTLMAGYRNRLTHFYDEVAAEEIYDIATHRLADIEAVLAALLTWLRTHPELTDGSL